MKTNLKADPKSILRYWKGNRGTEVITEVMSQAGSLCAYAMIELEWWRRLVVSLSGVSK